MQAVLHDGRVLEFPDGTDPATIQAAVKRVLANPTGFGGAPTAGDAAMGALGTIGHGITGLATVLESTYGIPAGVLAKYVTMGGNLAHLTTMSPQEAQQHVQNFFVGQPQGELGQNIVSAAGLPAQAAQEAAHSVGVPDEVTQGALDAASLIPGAGLLHAGLHALPAAVEQTVARAPIPDSRGLIGGAGPSVAEAAGYKGLNSKADLKTPGAQAVTNALLSSELKLPTGAKPNVAAVQDARTAGPGQVYNAAESSMPATMSAAQLAPYIRGISGPVSLLGNPESVANLMQTILSKPDFTPEVLFNTIRQARERGAAGLDSDLPDAQALGEAHLKLAGALENFVGDQLAANPNALVSLDQYQGARVDMAKSYLAEKALKGGENFDPAIYAKAMQRDPNLLTGNGAIVGQVANALPAGASPSLVKAIGAAGGAATGAALGAGAGVAADSLLPGLGHSGVVGGSIVGTTLAPLIQHVVRSLRTGRGDVEAASAAANNPALSYFHQPDYAFPSQPAPPPPAQGPLPLNPQLSLQPAPGAIGPRPPAPLPTDLGQQFGMFGPQLDLNTPGQVGRPPPPTVQPPLPLNPALRLKAPPGKVGKSAPSAPSIADLADAFYHGEG